MTLGCRDRQGARSEENREGELWRPGRPEACGEESREEAIVGQSTAHATMRYPRVSFLRRGVLAGFSPKQQLRCCAGRARWRRCRAHHRQQQVVPYGNGTPEIGG